jgi:hypothetical protein
MVWFPEIFEINRGQCFNLFPRPPGPHFRPRFSTVENPLKTRASIEHLTLEPYPIFDLFP